MASPSPKKLKPVAPAVDPLGAMVDEAGRLEAELAPFESKISRLDSLRKSIRARFDSAPAAAPQTTEGAAYRADLGARGNVSSIDVQKLATLAGGKEVLAVADVALKTVKASFPAYLAAVLSYSQTGSRSLNITPKVHSA